MRRAGSVLLVLAVIAAGGFGLLQFVVARDDSEVATQPGGGPGQAVETECPQTSARITRDRRPLTEDQRAHLLSLGNVILQGPDLSRLAAVQEKVSGRFDPEFAAAGLMVVLEPEGSVRALAWGRELRPGSADDPALEEFASTYLGRGAGDSCG